MKTMLRTLLLGFAVSGFSHAASADVTKVVRMADANETYLGDITYQGGLLYRGALALTAPTQVNTFRLEVPAFCKATPFEVGFVINNMYESADVVDAKNLVYRSRSGQAVLANGIYVSLNGEQAGNCHVLVFKTAGVTNPTNPTNGSNYVACVTNTLPAPLVFAAQIPGRSQNVVVQAYETIAVITTNVAGTVFSRVTLSFDQDLTLGYDPASYQLNGAWQTAADCKTAPNYDFRQNGFNRVGLFQRP